MGDADVFAKFSRILETQSLDSDDDQGVETIMSNFSRSELGFSPNTSSKESKSRFDTLRQSQTQSVDEDNWKKPSPFEVWKQKQKSLSHTPKETPKLSEQQWDKLVGKMHQSSRSKQSAVIREQNHGLAIELGGFDFKPKINENSKGMSSSMKKLQVRLPELLADREKQLKKLREEKIQDGIKECTFKPNRIGSKASDWYLRKMGRDKVSPEDLFLYREEKMRRNEQRKQIIDEIESRELTFKPRINLKSHKLQEKLLQSNIISVDPATRTRYLTGNNPSLEASTRISSAAASLGLGLGDDPLSAMSSSSSTFLSKGKPQPQLQQGPTLCLESAHPYKHNSNDYCTVNIPNAVVYSITFDEETATEPIHDFVKFYKDDGHEEYFGAGKYHGGMQGTACNWPGLGGRPPLKIHASKFIVHFRSNGTVNDWGFRMKIVPFIDPNPEEREDIYSRLGQPEITSMGRNYGTNGGGGGGGGGAGVTGGLLEGGGGGGGGDGKVHERLYQSGMEKKTEKMNEHAERMEMTLNVRMRAWEGKRDLNEPKPWAMTRTHLSKSEVVTQQLLEQTIVPTTTTHTTLADPYSPNSPSFPASSSSSPLTVIEFDDSLLPLWRQLNQTQPMSASEWVTYQSQSQSQSSSSPYQNQRMTSLGMGMGGMGMGETGMFSTNR